jgi:hypothetical protein
MGRCGTGPVSIEINEKKIETQSSLHVIMDI